ncbi:PAS domain S-box-containing protein [Tangfeifania diversioriginum]|uniref:histidine kinase n=1 Tax=Tangfeifania diversioriginum TaxID=1168035 RepID=A0A1M6I1I0_9BACT|nr:PAS domain S-box protein [Tangfeifania diversioriginum]SHJ28297.1 PAS domain S-box-containing protein [Tangfeifania diversioriginum]
MEPILYSDQPDGRKSLKERIRALLLKQNYNLSENELNEVLEEVGFYQQALEKRTHDLGEREKELNCLYNLSLLVEKPDITAKELFQSLVELVPGSWQYPEITCARIIYNGKEFKTANFKETPWKQSAPVLVDNEKKGTFDIFLLEEKPDLGEGPFLKEERNLLDTLAKNVGYFLERRKMIKALRDSEENQRVILHSLGDAVIAADTNGQVIQMNPIAEQLTGWSFSEAGNKPIDVVFRIVNATTGRKVENPVKRVLETGKIVGLANHTKLISKNGKEYQISDSGAPIKDDQGAVMGVVLVFRDVTEEYNIQQKLKENEERFRVIVEGAPDPIFIQSEMKFAYLNPVACKLFGVKSADELVGTPVMERFHPDYHEKIRERVRNLNTERKSVVEPLEQIFLRVDGSEVWVETSGEPIFYKGKNGALVFVRDITARKKAEKELAHSHELMRYIIEHANSAVAVHDCDLKYVYVSQQYLQQYKLVETDIIGKNHYDIFPDLPQKWRDVHQKALRGEVSKAERDPYYRDDGSIDWTRWECRPWYKADGEIGGIVLYTEVITERIEAENALRENERRLSTLMDNLPGMAYRCKNDAEWTMEFVSSGCLPLTGYPADELNNNEVISYGQLIHPDDRKKVWEEVQAAIKENRSFVTEYWITDKNGKEHWVWEQGRAINSDSEEQDYIEGFIMDITQRKLAETELKQRMEELEKFNRVMVGRENRMIELKRDINELLMKLGQPKKYRIQDENEEN